MQFVAPLVFVGFLVLMFLAFRGQQRRQRELTHMQATLEVGDEVMLTSGVFGTLVSVGDDRVGLEVADGVVLQVARGAVGETVRPVDGPEGVDDARQDEITRNRPAPTTTDATRDADVSEES